MRISIHWKLAAVFLLFSATLLSILYFYLNTNIDRYLEDQLVAKLKGELRLGAELAGQALRSYSQMPDVAGIVERISDALGLRATFIDGSGVVIGDSEVGRDGVDSLDNHIHRPEVQQAIRTGMGISRRFSTSVRKPMIYIAMPVEIQGKTGILRLSMSLAEVEARR